MRRAAIDQQRFVSDGRAHCTLISLRGVIRRILRLHQQPSVVLASETHVSILLDSQELENCTTDYPIRYINQAHLGI